MPFHFLWLIVIEYCDTVVNLSFVSCPVFITKWNSNLENFLFLPKFWQLLSFFHEVSVYFVSLRGAPQTLSVKGRLVDALNEWSWTNKFNLLLITFCERLITTAASLSIRPTLKERNAFNHDQKKAFEEDSDLENQDVCLRVHLRDQACAKIAKMNILRHSPDLLIDNHLYDHYCGDINQNCVLIRYHAR